MGTTLYTFQVTGTQDTIVDILASEEYYDAGPLSATKNLALKILYDCIGHHDYHKDITVGEGSPLDMEISQKDAFNSNYMKTVCHQYIASVSLDDWSFRIEVTDKKWIEHLFVGLLWESAIFDDGEDFPPPSVSNVEAIDQNTLEVDLSDQDISMLSGEFFKNAHNLRKLNLSENRLQALSEKIDNLTSLETLDLSENMLRGLPESFGNLSKLKVLNLNENSLESLPESFGNLPNLDTLIIAEDGEEMPRLLPESFAYLPNLRVLKAAGDGLERLPKEIRQLPKLEEIDIRVEDEQGVAAFYELCHIPTLKVLKISRVNTVPREIGNLKNLKELHLSSSDIYRLPQEISKLQHLEKLVLENADFDVFPEAIRLLGKQLKFLSIKENEQYLTLPEWLGELTALEELCLQYNREGVALPASLSKLKNLKKLDLSWNNLLELPEVVTELSNLEELDLGGNELGSLPQSFEKLQQLKKLDIGGNPVEAQEADWRKKLPHTKFED